MFPVDTRSVKMIDRLKKINTQIDVSIFRHHCLSLLWTYFWKDFSIDTMPKTPPICNQFHHDSCFEHLWVRLKMNQGHLINNCTVTFVVSCCVAPKQVKISTILESTDTWLHGWYLSGVCALSSPSSLSPPSFLSSSLPLFFSSPSSFFPLSLSLSSLSPSHLQRAIIPSILMLTFSVTVRYVTRSGRVWTMTRFLAPTQSLRMICTMERTTGCMLITFWKSLPTGFTETLMTQAAWWGGLGVAFHGRVSAFMCVFTKRSLPYVVFRMESIVTAGFHSWQFVKCLIL